MSGRADGLSDAAGEDHDLVVLLDGAHRRAETLQRSELELLNGPVGRRRAALQKDARARGERVYGRKPRKLARRKQGAV